MKRRLRTAKAKNHAGRSHRFDEPRPFEQDRYRAPKDDAPYSELDDEHDDDDTRSGTNEGEPASEETANSPDDALGLYLRQMGAIPLLNREQELKLARQLERLRRRFRHAAFCAWEVLGRVIETFERIHGGTLAVDPQIDVIGSLGL